MNRHLKSRVAEIFLGATWALMAVVGSSRTAHAQADRTLLSAKAPWRGSSVTYRNVMSVMNLAPDSELTYNPYYAMEAYFNAMWWFGDKFYARGNFFVSRELTNSDDTTKQGETWLSDLLLRGGAQDYYTIPVVNIALSADADLIVPTSPLSRARSMMLGLAGAVEFRRDFDLFAGATVGYRLRGLKGFYQYTTAERAEPVLPSCATPDQCSSFLNAGLRNPSAQLHNIFYGGIQFTRWFGVFLTFWMRHDFLFGAADDPRVSLDIRDAADTRYFLITDVNARFRPWGPLVVSIGAQALQPQQKPDSSYYVPYFNRNVQLYLDLGVDIATLVNQIRGWL